MVALDLFGRASRRSSAEDDYLAADRDLGLVDHAKLLTGHQSPRLEMSEVGEAFWTPSVQSSAELAEDAREYDVMMDEVRHALERKKLDDEVKSALEEEARLINELIAIKAARRSKAARVPIGIQGSAVGGSARDEAAISVRAVPALHDKVGATPKTPGRKGKKMSKQAKEARRINNLIQAKKQAQAFSREEEARLDADEREAELVSMLPMESKMQASPRTVEGSGSGLTGAALVAAHAGQETAQNECTDSSEAHAGDQSAPAAGSRISMVAAGDPRIYDAPPKAIFEKARPEKRETTVGNRAPARKYADSAAQDGGTGEEMSTVTMRTSHATRGTNPAMRRMQLLVHQRTMGIERVAPREPREHQTSADAASPPLAHRTTISAAHKSNLALHQSLAFDAALPLEDMERMNASVVDSTRRGVSGGKLSSRGVSGGKLSKGGGSTSYRAQSKSSRLGHPCSGSPSAAVSTASDGGQQRTQSNHRKGGSSSKKRVKGGGAGLSEDGTSSLLSAAREERLQQSQQEVPLETLSVDTVVAEAWNMWEKVAMPWTDRLASGSMPEADANSNAGDFSSHVGDQMAGSSTGSGAVDSRSAETGEISGEDEQGRVGLLLESRFFDGDQDQDDYDNDDSGGGSGDDGTDGSDGEAIAGPTNDADDASMARRSGKPKVQLSSEARRMNELIAAKLEQVHRRPARSCL